MFALVALVAAAAALPASFNLPGKYPKEFAAFVEKYHKTYTNEAEKMLRFDVFNVNMERVKVLQELSELEEYGASPFMDVSEDEFKKLYTGSEMKEAAGPIARPIAATNTTDFDWRAKGAVTPVKNQGQCGSCWSFSATGNMEGVHYLATKNLVSLSEQNLVDCDKVDQGCNGGLPSNAFQFVIKEGGIDTEASYKYQGTDGSCHYSASNLGAKISNWTKISKDEDQIAAQLLKHGPLSIGINAGQMQLYHGGIAKPWHLGPLKFCNPKKLDHGVLIVGFGVGTEGKEKGIKYWTIKNSWGPSWGEKGYYRIVRGEGACGLNQMVTSAIA